MGCTHSLEMEGDNNKNIRNIADNNMNGVMEKRAISISQDSAGNNSEVVIPPEGDEIAEF